EMCETFPLLFQTMELGEVPFAVVAIENSVAGTILPNYAMLRDSSLTIIGEVLLRIEHCLMALPGQEISELREVHSHPMALAQCQRFFRQHPHLRLIEHPDTAGAARWIRDTQRQGAAAVASRLASKHYQMPMLAEGIEDNPRNFTRFLILLDQAEASKLNLEPNKASLCFNLLHKVGSLSQILLVLSAHGMNLTKIQSLPIVGREWEYFFHLDLEYDDHQQYLRALAAITPLVNELQILGEYTKAQHDA
ncbi:MAG: prephenate dehydratase domain-containing protein, partial [Bacteroidota bacterium]